MPLDSQEHLNSRAYTHMHASTNLDIIKSNEQSFKNYIIFIHSLCVLGVMLKNLCVEVRV